MISNKHILAAAMLTLVMSGASWAVGEAISQKGKIFSPDEMYNAVGETVMINNDDSIPHHLQVTAPDGVVKNMGLQMPGDRAEIPVEKAGDYMVRCGIHPKMKLVIHVK